MVVQGDDIGYDIAAKMNSEARIVITGIGLTAPNGNNLTEFRQNLLAGKSGVGKIETHYMGEVIAGICHFDPLKYQKKKRSSSWNASRFYCDLFR